MARSRSQKTLEIEERRRKVAALYLAHTPQTEIARQLGVTQQTVSLDVQAIRKQYRQERTELIDRDAAVLDQMELEVARQHQGSKGTDKDWYKIRLAIHERRARLLGLDAPTKVAETDTQGKDVPRFRFEGVVVHPPKENGEPAGGE